MKILLYDDKKRLEEEKISIEMDKKICLFDSIPIIYEKNISKDSMLILLDFLLDLIPLDIENEFYYYGSHPRVWAYLLIFAYIDNKISMYYKEKLVEESCLLKLNLKNMNYGSEKIQEFLVHEEYIRLPEFIRNLYYNKAETDSRHRLSKAGKIYVKNIKN